MRKKPKHIIWDWNGTLQDDVDAAINGINHLLKQRNMPTVDIEKHRDTFTFPVRDYYLKLGFDLDNEDWHAMANEFFRVFSDDTSKALFPGTVQTLSVLHKNMINMSILSAAEQVILEHSLDNYGIRRYFVNVYGQNNHEAGSKLKQAEMLFNKIGENPSDIWIIGDTTHDKEIADEMKCNSIIILGGYQSRKRFETLNCQILDSIMDVPRFFSCV